MTRAAKRGGKIWVRIFPDKPYTKKPAETRMGKGKGAPEGWVAVVKPGRILYEMEGVDLPTAQGSARARGRQDRPEDAARDPGIRDGDPMKKKEREALASQGLAELHEKEKQLKEAAWKLRLQKATGQLENPSAPAGGRAGTSRASRRSSGQLELAEKK